MCWVQSWRRGTKCDCRIDWLWVRSPLKEMKYLFTFIFSFLRSGVEAKRSTEFRHSTRSASRTRRKVVLADSRFWILIKFITYSFFSKIFKYIKYQLHTVSRTQQGRQREPSVQTLRSPLSAWFWRHCVLRGRNQRRALPRHQSEENGNINLSKYLISSSGDRTHNQSILQSHFVPLRHDWPHIKIIIYYI